jgi:exopolysaccharide production protein ExoQ
MSYPALLACIGLIVWMIRWEKRNFPHQPGFLWLPTLWMMRCSSRGIDGWLSGSEGGRIDPLFVAVILILGLIVLSRRRISWGALIAHNFALLVFFGFLFASVFWAQELADPVIKLFRPATDLVMALIVITVPDPKEAIVAVFRRTSIFLIPLSIVLIRYFPHLGTMPHKHWGMDNWIGVTTHKNPLGQLCLMATLVFVWDLARDYRAGKPVFKARIEWLYLAMCIYLFNGGGEEDSRSTTSMLCTVVALLAFYTIGRMRHNLNKFTSRVIRYSVLGGALFGVMTFFEISPKELIAKSQGKGVDLAGRDLIWSETIRLGMDTPIVGHGFGGFWVQSIWDRMDPRVDNKPMQAHNGYIEVFANLGFIGLGLLFVFLSLSVVSAMKLVYRDFEYGRLRLVILSVVLLMNYSEATFPVALHTWWFGFLLVAFSVPSLANPGTVQTRIKTAGAAVPTYATDFHMSPRL